MTYTLDDVDPEALAAYEETARTAPGGQTFMSESWLNGFAKRSKDRSAAWLKGAVIGLGLLAVAAATVSVRAQYVMVDAARHQQVISAVEAAIPDVAALIFACLGIALALRGKRAYRARFLNAGAVATSVFMNFAAAGHGWRNIAIWLMPPVAYALASDTCIVHVRAWFMALQQMADDDSSVLGTIARGLRSAALYPLRFVLDTRGTARGLKAAVLIATPLPELPASPTAKALVAIDRTQATIDAVRSGKVTAEPGSFFARAAEAQGPLPQAARKPAASNGSAPIKAAANSSANGSAPRGTKQPAFLDLVKARYGAIAAIELAAVAAIAKEVAPEVDLNEGQARKVLRAAVQQAQESTEVQS
jgi:hypothetical protein